jgi:4-amino-4-deoxy-L-arabinose transferase-like glycosyltransferase
LAVALLYATVRSVWGRRAGILAALSLAVLPVSVLTARSDTMDSVAYFEAA